jgi:hypothetical protein
VRVVVVLVLVLVVVVVVTTGKQSQLPGLALGGSLTKIKMSECVERQSYSLT